MKIRTYSLIKHSYFMSILLISALPTGTLLNIPVKMLASFLLILSFICALYRYKVKISKNAVLFIFLGISILFLYTAWGVINFGYISLLEAKLILITFALTSIVYMFHTRIFSKPFFFQVYSYATFSIFLIKIIAYMYGYMNAGRETIITFYHLLFNSQIVSLDLPYGMVRLYVQTDIIAAFYPLVLSWAVREKIVSHSFTANFILIASGVVVASSFSRYLITVFTIGIFLYTYLRKSFLRLIISILLFLLILYLFHDVVMEFIKFRLCSNKSSDSIRSEQVPLLISLFLESPYFGFGFGAYNPTYIRSIIHPFSYEMQIISFLPKVGLIGITIILSGLFYIIYKFSRKHDIIGLISIFLFVLSGWFNPYLYSSNVVLIYVFILIMSSTNYRQKEVAFN